MIRRVCTRSLTCLCLLICVTAIAQDFDSMSDEQLERLSKLPMLDRFVQLYNKQCAVCHGEDLLGAPLGTPLVGVELRHGDSVAEITESIAGGFPESGMPAWSETLSADWIHNLALYVAEQRQGTTIVDKRANIPLRIPDGVVETERHAFRVKTIATGLHPMPFSIAALPNGRFLLTEKMRGLSIISRDGEQSELIKGAPKAYADASTFFGQLMGVGWMLDVAIHPDFEDNGWIYLQYGDRCSDCNEVSRQSGKPVSLNKLVRGRIKDGEWVDEETIWQADVETYSTQGDIAAGGRIAFDGDGHVFISVGMKGSHEHIGIQDLDMPYGKIHRVHDDGQIPPDNPFVDVPGALKSTWSYGHRSTQGLEFNHATGQLWCTEMGPRGGDELNLVLPGRNYGWPLYTSGVNYDGRPVDYWDALGIELAPEDVEQPILDMTPSPAISSFVFYQGTEFPNWNNNIIVGTLRATDLKRMEVVNNQVVHTETLLEDLARFRDIDIGPGGELYILLEHATGGQIIRLVATASGDVD